MCARLNGVTLSILPLNTLCVFQACLEMEPDQHRSHHLFEHILERQRSDSAVE